MNVERYKEFYDHAWQRHEHLQSAVNTPISIVTLLAGGLVLMGKSFESEAAGLRWLFWTATAAAGVLVGISVYLLIRSIHGYHYERMPLASALAAHYSALVEYYRHMGKPGLSNSAFDEYLAKWYMTVADHNVVNNVKRGEYLYKANRFLVYALCATAMAAIPAGIAVKSAQPHPQDVRITNLRSDASEILERRDPERSAPDATRPPRRGGTR
jgi:hypothetical protein